MSIGDCVSGYQRQIICNLIRQQQMKKTSIKNKDIYEKHKGDSEFWQRLANKLTDELINSKGGCCEDYNLSSKGLIQGIGYNLEFTDSYNKEKFIICADGNVEGPITFTPTKGLEFDGFDIFRIVMFFVYLILFFIFIDFDSTMPVIIVFVLGVLNLFSLLL